MSSDLKAHFWDVDWGVLRTFLVNVYQFLGIPQDMEDIQELLKLLWECLCSLECVWGNGGKWKSQLCFRGSRMDWQGHQGSVSSR